MTAELLPTTLGAALLAAPMLPTDTTMTLASGPTGSGPVPSGTGQFRVAIASPLTGFIEILIAQSPPASGNVYTVTRAAEGPNPPSTYPRGWPVVVSLTMAGLANLLATAQATEQISVASPAAVAALAPPVAYPAGTLAFAQSTGQTFQLVTGSTLTVDGATVLTATAAAGGGAAQWVDARYVAEAVDVVRVTATGDGGTKLSPYTAAAGQKVIADTSAGSVVVNLPVLALGQSVTVKHDENTSLAAATVTVHGPGPDVVALAQPAPSNAAGFVSPFAFGGGGGGIFAGEAARGMSMKWANLGSGGGYVLE